MGGLQSADLFVNLKLVIYLAYKSWQGIDIYYWHFL